MDVQPRFIVVIGTSAGGITALTELVAQFTPEYNAAFFIVMHLSHKGFGEFLVHRLQKATTLTCVLAKNDEPIKKGHIYIAPPDEHLLLNEGKVVLGSGPAENRWRPSVNNLFRSAAAAYADSVIGIILTGFLDDGTAGMSAIKRSGGMCIVQDPNEAEYPDMPLSVLNAIEVDYCVPLADMGSIIWEITQTVEPGNSTVPKDVITEAAIDRSVSISLSNLEPFDKTQFNCPDCGGGLWLTISENPVHYCCHVGHSFTGRDLLIRQAETMESTLWTALRIMEERRNLLLQFHQREVKKGLKISAGHHLKRAEEMTLHINNLKQLLFDSRNVE